MSVHGSRQQAPCRCLCTKKQSIGAAAMAVSVKLNSPLYSQAAHQKGRSCQLSGAEVTRHSFAIGRLTTPFLVRTETVRTQPFSSGNVCRMRPTNHWPLGAVLSTNRTRRLRKQPALSLKTLNGFPRRPMNRRVLQTATNSDSPIDQNGV